MEEKKFKYEIAFSFLAEDEALATELNDLLQDRLSTFLYSKRQNELAGTDGENVFNEVFGSQSRLVVVLFRTGWGATPWTRIEQIAIRNRAYDEGYDFVIFVPLEDPASVPKWLPKSQLWIGLKRWGLLAAAGVLESRVQELGGMPREESVEDRATRLERKLEFEKKRREFERSHEGVREADLEFNVLADELERLVTEIERISNTIKYTTKRDNRRIDLLGWRSGLSIIWKVRYTNSLDDSKLDVGLWEGYPPFPGVSQTRDEPTLINRNYLEYGMLWPGHKGWKTTASPEREFNSKELAEFLFKFYIDETEKHFSI